MARRDLVYHNRCGNYLCERNLAHVADFDAPTVTDVASLVATAVARFGAWLPKRWEVTNLQSHAVQRSHVHWLGEEDSNPR